MIPYIALIYFMYFTLLLSRRFKDSSIKSYIYDSSNAKLYNKRKKSYANFATIIALIALIVLSLFAGLRDNLGTDYPEYVKIFYSINRRNTLNTNIEIGFTIINLIVGKLTGNNVIVLFLVCAFIIHSTIFKGIKDNTQAYELGIFLFIAFGFLGSSFNIMRQWMATGIIFCSFKYMFNKQFFRYAIVVCIAATMHISAYFMLFLYPFFVYNKSDIVRIILIICAFLILQYTREIFSFFYNLLIDTNFRYLKYLNPNKITMTKGRGLTFPSFSLLIYVFYLFFKHKGVDIDKSTEMQINILIIGFVMSVVGQRIALVLRLQYHTVAILVILIPNLVYKIKEKQVLLFIILLLGLGYFLYDLYYNNYIPYRWVL